MTKIITSLSPKTSGNSIFLLNLSLFYQFEHREQKVGLLQLSNFSDLDIYTNHKNVKNLGDLCPFLGTEEWNESLLDIIKSHNGVDLFFTPDFEDLKNTPENLKNFKQIWQLCLKKYDVLFIDISKDIGENIQNFVQTEAQKNILVGTMDPCSLSAIQNFMDRKKINSKKVELVLNQCPKNGLKYLEKKLSMLNIPLLGILPVEKKYIWSQVYEGFPILGHKKSAYKKSLKNILEKI